LPLDYQPDVHPGVERDERPDNASPLQTWF
jgi:hypothetical protein